MSNRAIKVAVVISVLVLCGLIGACNYASSFDAPRKGYSAICQTGGPIEGNSGTCGFLPTGSGKSMVGYENTLVEFPSTNRFWRAANNPENPAEKAPRADIKAVDLPASNGGIVSVSYTLRFKLKQDENTLTKFYNSQATRSFGGAQAADNPDEWFLTWEESTLSPTIERVLREEVSQYACADLNPSCDLTKLNTDLEQLAADEKDQSADEVAAQEKIQKAQQERGREANQTLSKISAAVLKRIGGPEGEFAKELEGDFLTGMNFQINKVDPPADLIGEINGANAALAGLVKAKAEARTKTATATGTADARVEEARGRKALAQSYDKNSALADIEIAKALCGETGCQNLQVLGGGVNLLKQMDK